LDAKPVLQRTGFLFEFELRISDFGFREPERAVHAPMSHSVTAPTQNPKSEFDFELRIADFVNPSAPMSHSVTPPSQNPKSEFPNPKCLSPLSRITVVLIIR
jgi:hypothetical protein